MATISIPAVFESINEKSILKTADEVLNLLVDSNVDILAQSDKSDSSTLENDQIKKRKSILKTADSKKKGNTYKTHFNDIIDVQTYICTYKEMEFKKFRKSNENKLIAKTCPSISEKTRKVIEKHQNNGFNSSLTKSFASKQNTAQKALVPSKSTTINFNSSLTKQYSAKQNNVQKPNFSSSAPSNFYNDRISNQVFLIQQQQSQKKFQQLQQQRRLSSNFSSSNPAIPNNQRRQSFGGSFNTSQPLTAFCSNTPVSYPGYGQTLSNNYQYCTPIKNGMLSNAYIQSLPCAFTHGNLKFRA